MGGKACNNVNSTNTNQNCLDPSVCGLQQVDMCVWSDMDNQYLCAYVSMLTLSSNCRPVSPTVATILTYNHHSDPTITQVRHQLRLPLPNLPHPQAPRCVLVKRRRLVRQRLVSRLCLPARQHLKQRDMNFNGNSGVVHINRSHQTQPEVMFRYHYS